MTSQLNPLPENDNVNSLSENDIVIETGANTKDVVISSDQTDSSNTKELNVDTHNDMR